MWRPLEGPLTPAARLQALIILRSLFAFLVSQGYVAATGQNASWNESEACH